MLHHTGTSEAYRVRVSTYSSWSACSSLYVYNSMLMSSLLLIHGKPLRWDHSSPNNNKEIHGSTTEKYRLHLMLCRSNRSGNEAEAAQVARSADDTDLVYSVVVVVQNDMAIAKS